MRHGETDTNRKHIWQCSMDEPLNDTGRAQAREAANFVMNLRPDVIVSSDLSRARETAQIVASHLDDVEMRIEPGLRERSCGDAEGLNTDGIQKKFGFRMEMTSSLLDNVPGAEAYGHFAQRILETFNRIYDETGTSRVLAVCHGGVMRTFYNEQINPVPLGIVFHNCAIITTARENGRWSIVDRYKTDKI